jgi:SAM-dependent methyltransferase
MSLHPLAQAFASVPDAYERGRPEYPPAVVGALAAELGIGPGEVVLDLAAGTGKLSRALVAGGHAVVAVEPLAELRTLLSERIGAGVAEAIPLADASVAAVTVADAFHWFDQPRALAEIRRVLRPGGGLAVISMAPDWRDASWAHELGTLLSGRRPEHPHFDGPPWSDAVRAAGGWGEPREIRVTTHEPSSPERVVDHMASMSWVAVLPADERAQLLEQIRALLAAGEMPNVMPQHATIGLARLLT